MKTNKSGVLHDPWDCWKRVFPCWALPWVCLCCGTLRMSLKENFDVRIYSLEKSFRIPPLLPVCSSLMHMFWREPVTFCTEFSCVLPSLNCRTRSCLRRLSESSWGGSVQYKSSNGWEFSYGWATPNKTCSQSCVLLLHVGWSVSMLKPTSQRLMG